MKCGKTGQDLQGRAPFPYALAELIDNSLRASIRGRTTGRKIAISLVLNTATSPSSGLISVWDNGCGMSKLEMNEWAVMNLSMEDRGAKPTEEVLKRGAAQVPGASRFLSGNLSYFGVSLLFNSPSCHSCVNIISSIECLDYHEPSWCCRLDASTRTPDVMEVPRVSVN
jgi:hypothetical protein